MHKKRLLEIQSDGSLSFCYINLLQDKQIKIHKKDYKSILTHFKNKNKSSTLSLLPNTFKKYYQI